jgi:hypothetical protein
MPDVQLGEREARLVYLATVYHLGRPGSEVDPVSRQPHGEGLGPVSEVLSSNLANSLERAPVNGAVTLALSEYQLGRLGEALLGLVNELKQVSLSGRSVVPGFIEALRRVFPEETEDADPSGAMDLTAEATMLHRRLAGAILEAQQVIEAARLEQATPARSAHPWWKVWGG